MPSLPHPVPALLRAWHRLLRQESGNAIVEMAFCVSLLGIPILFATVDLGTMVYYSIEVSDAAHAGAMYGMISSTFAASSSGIITAATNDAPDLDSLLAVTPTVFYACSESLAGIQYSAQSAATSACTGGSNHPLEFVKVVTSATVHPAIRCPGLPTSYTLVGTSVMEVEE